MKQLKQEKINIIVHIMELKPWKIVEEISGTTSK